MVLADRADEAKKRSAVFDSGMGARVVRDENSQIPDSLLARTMAPKEKIIYSPAGASEVELRNLLDKFGATGLSVREHYGDVEVNKAVDRVVARYNHAGRILPVTSTGSLGDKPINSVRIVNEI